MENKNIDNELEAWLMFYSTQDPDRIVELIQKYPMFSEMYGNVYEICRNMEKVMEMFSEELREMDRNTVQYMIDEMQEKIDEMQETIDAQSVVLQEERKGRKEEKRRYEEEKRKQEENNKKQQELMAAALEDALKRIDELERKNGSESSK